MVLGSGIRDPRSGIRDPGSGKNLFRIPDPGAKKHPIPDPGSRIRIRNTAYRYQVYRDGIAGGICPIVKGSFKRYYYRAVL